MPYICPKCERPWMEWCGRAKILLCHGSSCNHVIRDVGMVGKIPTPMEIHKAIFLDTIRTALTPFLGEPNTDENRVKMAHVVAKIIKKGF